MNDSIKIVLIMLLVLLALSPEMTLKLTFLVIGIVIELLLVRIVKTRKEK